VSGYAEGENSKLLGKDTLKAREAKKNLAQEGTEKRYRSQTSGWPI